ncbi:MAG: DNA alkylation repair protein [Clostridia bacterium]|nr:DNA alkylation repair protein [Clostridia bacterium]
MQNEIEAFLRENADEKKAKFDGGLIHTKYKIWGIKTKNIEDFSKKLAKKGAKIEDFHISSLEEVLLAGLTIAYSKISNKEKLERLEKLLPYMDNWGATDMIVPRLKNMEEERGFFENLLHHANPFYVRTGIVWLKRFVLKNDLENVITMLSKVTHPDYYVKMALAWTYQEALTIDFDYMYKFTASLQDEFIKLKTISKACDSYRLTIEQKEKLKEFRLQAKYRLEN